MPIVAKNRSPSPPKIKQENKIMRNIKKLSLFAILLLTTFLTMAEYNAKVVAIKMRKSGDVEWKATPITVEQGTTIEIKPEFLSGNGSPTCKLHMWQDNSGVHSEVGAEQSIEAGTHYSWVTNNTAIGDYYAKTKANNNIWIKGSKITVTKPVISIEAINIHNSAAVKLGGMVELSATVKPAIERQLRWEVLSSTTTDTRFKSADGSLVDKLENISSNNQVILKIGELSGGVSIKVSDMELGDECQKTRYISIGSLTIRRVPQYLFAGTKYAVPITFSLSDYSAEIITKKDENGNVISDEAGEPVMIPATEITNIEVSFYANGKLQFGPISSTTFYKYGTSLTNPQYLADEEIAMNKYVQLAENGDLHWGAIYINPEHFNNLPIMTNALNPNGMSVVDAYFELTIEYVKRQESNTTSVVEKSKSPLGHNDLSGISRFYDKSFPVYDLGSSN